MNVKDRAGYLKNIDEVIEKGRFKDNWNSLAQHRTPEWLQKAKFGIFIHWGIYSVPAFANEWYSRNMYIKDSVEYKHHVAVYGEHKEFGYKDFIPMFKAENYNPEEWAEFFRESGAKYVVPVAEHHDGFQMYNSDLSEWNAVDKGPKRDLVGELLTACEKRGIQPCASSHRVEHWFFMNGGKEFDSDIKEPMQCGDFYWPAEPLETDLHDIYSEPIPSQEFMEDWLMRCCEFIDKYRPRFFYFDWWVQHSAVKPYMKKFMAYYYNRSQEWGEQVTVCYKHEALMFGTGTVDIERGKFPYIQPFFWQTDTAVAKNSWCYTENNNYKTPCAIICDLIDIVSKNGTLLLNIGPKADGTIPQEDRNVLSTIGKWLDINGEGIFDTTTWRVAAEGPTETKAGQFTDGDETAYTPRDIRFTVKGENIYAFILKCPEEDNVMIESLAERSPHVNPTFQGIIKSITLLGYEDKLLNWKRDEMGLHITLPKGINKDYPITFKIIIE